MIDCSWSCFSFLKGGTCFCCSGTAIKQQQKLSFSVPVQKTDGRCSVARCTFGAVSKNLKILSSRAGPKCPPSDTHMAPEGLAKSRICLEIPSVSLQYFLVVCSCLLDHRFLDRILEGPRVPFGNGFAFCLWMCVLSSFPRSVKNPAPHESAVNSG